MGQQSNLCFWIIIIGIPIGFLCLVSDILFPFIASFIIAYFLHPTISRLHRKGISRTVATLGIMSLFFLIMGLISLLLAPALYNELLMLAAKVPEYITFAQKEVIPKISRFAYDLSPELVHTVTRNIGNFSSYILSFFVKVSTNIINSGATIVNILSLIFITPIVTFYTLRDWKKITASLERLYPPHHSTVIHEQISLIDQTLSGYLRGQLNVCLIMSIFYVTALSIMGLDFSLIIGIISGMLMFIPYVGAFVGLIIGCIICILQYGDLFHLAILLAIYCTGQVLESFFITPRLIGANVGLHPIWVIFGMLAGGSLFGFVGVLLAIPLTAIIGVLVRFSIKQYLASSLFRKNNLHSRTDTPS
jgi:predicted PurR-regulated permease PerM